MALTSKQLKEVKDALTGYGRVLPAVRQVVMQEAAEDKKNRDVLYLHPSEICKKNWCPRSSYYTIKEGARPPESMAFSRMNVFAEGTAIHSKWQKWLAKAGILEGNWECRECHWRTYGCMGFDVFECILCSGEMKYREVPVVSQEYHIIGHADGIVSDDQGKAVLEIKSVGTGTVKFDAPEMFMPFSKHEITLEQLWANVRMPFPSHIRQVMLYMFLLNIEDAVVLYEWKPTQDVKEFKLKLNMEMIQPILDGCLSVKKALDTGRTPPRPQWATDEDHKVCVSCHYQKKCWGIDDNDQATVADSDGEVPVEVRPSGSTEGGSTPGTGPRRVVRRSTDGVVP